MGWTENRGERERDDGSDENGERYDEHHDKEPASPGLRDEWTGPVGLKSDQSDSPGSDSGRGAVQRAGEGRAHTETGPGTRQAQAHVVAEEAEFLSASWTGLLPHPADLGAYERVLPGAADRLLRVLESETVDRSKRADTLAKAKAKAEVASVKAGRRSAVVFRLLFTCLAAIFFLWETP